MISKSAIDNEIASRAAAAATAPAPSPAPSNNMAYDYTPASQNAEANPWGDTQTDTEEQQKENKPAETQQAAAQPAAPAASQNDNLKAAVANTQDQMLADPEFIKWMQENTPDDYAALFPQTSQEQKPAQPEVKTQPVADDVYDPGKSYGRQADGSYVYSSSAAQLQNELAKRGFYKGSIDGYFGQQTQQAVNDYLASRGNAVKGDEGAERLASLTAEDYDQMDRNDSYENKPAEKEKEPSRLQQLNDMAAYEPEKYWADIFGYTEPKQAGTNEANQTAGVNATGTAGNNVLGNAGIPVPTPTSAGVTPTGNTTPKVNSDELQRLEDFAALNRVIPTGAQAPQLLTVPPSAVPIYPQPATTPSGNTRPAQTEQANNELDMAYVQNVLNGNVNLPANAPPMQVSNGNKSQPTLSEALSQAALQQGTQTPTVLNPASNTATKNNAPTPKQAAREDAYRTQFQEDFSNLKKQFPTYSDTALMDMVLVNEELRNGQSSYYKWIASNL